jgi:hypothetical protein
MRTFSGTVSRQICLSVVMSLVDLWGIVVDLWWIRGVRWRGMWGGGSIPFHSSPSDDQGSLGELARIGAKRVLGIQNNHIQLADRG